MIQEDSRFLLSLCFALHAVNSQFGHRLQDVDNYEIEFGEAGEGSSSMLRFEKRPQI